MDRLQILFLQEFPFGKNPIKSKFLSNGSKLLQPGTHERRHNHDGIAGVGI